MNLFPHLILVYSLTPQQREGIHTMHTYILTPHVHIHSAGRRGSYLFLSDADDEDTQPIRSRASSMSSHIGDETYITPFAQVT